MSFEVIARAVDNNDAVAKEQQNLDRLPDFEKPEACGVYQNGTRCNGRKDCENWYEYEYGEGGSCRVKDYFGLQQKVMNLRWMPVMLDYYWRNGPKKDGFKFLQGSGFLISYK